MNTTTDLQSILQERFGFEQLRAGQSEIVASVMANRDVVAVLPTGGGKSLCYQLPAMCRSGIAVIVSPLISLMDDQVGALQAKGLPAAAIHSGHTIADKRVIFANMRDGDRFLLYISPERIQTPGFMEWFKAQDIQFVAIDEAHCISQWGHDFRPDYKLLGELRRLRPEVPMLALTATATPTVLDDIELQLQMRDPERHVYGFYRPNLYYQVEFCESDDDKLALLDAGLQRFPEGRILIYCGTRKLTEQLSAELSRRNHNIGFYHAGLDAATRDRIQRQYNDGNVRILAATNAFGMGIDHPDVRLVVHYQMPGNIESLYQEMGRAGRDGEPSTCLLLYSRKDKGLHNFFIQRSDADIKIKKQRWNALETLVQYAEGGDCRHAEILTYFRDSQRIDSCGHCDSCDMRSERRITLAGPLPSVASGKRKRIKKAKKVTLKVDAGKALQGDALERHRRLKAWRKDYAAEKDIPAFVVFSNRTLRQLAVDNPASQDELWKIHGLGEQKIDAFGTDILRVLRESAAQPQ